MITNTFLDNTLLMKDKIVWEKRKTIFTFSIDSQHLKMWQLNKKASNNIVTHRKTLVDCKSVCLSVNMREEGSKKVIIMHKRVEWRPNFYHNL